MKYITIITAILITSLSACKKDSFWGIRGEGNNVTKTINANGFSKIDLSIDATVSYMQDSIYKVEVSAQENIQEALDINTSGSILRIGSRHCLRDHNPIQIIVHSPNIYGFYLSGSGRINVQSIINTTSLELNTSGSGSISTSTLYTQDLSAQISGSGSIGIAGGTANTERFDISGSGNIESLNFQSNKSTVIMSGSGSASLWAIQNLDVDISGSGSVKYKGNPAVNSTISGSGKLIHIN